MRTESFEKSNGSNQENNNLELKANTSNELQIIKMNDSIHHHTALPYETNCRQNFEFDSKNDDNLVPSNNVHHIQNIENNQTETNYLNKLRQSDIKSENNKNESKKNIADYFTREAQTISRNKDLYLKLVNTAIYGNFNYKYYENATNYNKAAEYFALYGFGDSLDSTFQFDTCNNKSKTKLDDEKQNTSIKIKNLITPITSSQEQLITHDNKLTFGNPLHPPIPNLPHSNQIFPKAMNLLTSQQQVLMHLNQPANILSNYPATTLIQYGATPVWLTNSIPYFNAATAAAAAAYFNETHINTSIIQQQQQYNFFSGAGPYDIQYLGYYAQLLQRSQQITQTISANNRLIEQHQSRTTSTINPSMQYDSTSSKQINNINSSGSQS